MSVSTFWTSKLPSFASSAASARWAGRGDGCWCCCCGWAPRGSCRRGCCCCCGGGACCCCWWCGCCCCLWGSACAGCRGVAGPRYQIPEERRGGEGSEHTVKEGKHENIMRTPHIVMDAPGDLWCCCTSSEFGHTNNGKKQWSLSMVNL